MELPPGEIRFNVEFKASDPSHDVNNVLSHLYLGDTDCELNSVIFPAAWPVGRLQDPPVAELPTHWIPWDEELCETTQVHLYVADAPLFRALASSD